MGTRMTVGQLVALLQRMPPEALLVFEDAADEEFSYEDVEVEFNADSEVIIRTV
jgi:hypothetical protein